MPFQPGDYGIVNSMKWYMLIVGVGILAPLIFVYIILFFGFGFIGLTSSSQGSTVLPPLVTLIPFMVLVFIASVEFATFDTGFVGPLIVLHLVTLVVAIILNIIPSWNDFFGCIGGSISCPGAWDYIVYGLALITIVIMGLAVLLGLFVILDYGRRIQRRNMLASYDSITYDEMTDSVQYVSDQDLPGGQREDEQDQEGSSVFPDVTSQGRFRKAATVVTGGKKSYRVKGGGTRYGPPRKTSAVQ